MTSSAPRRLANSFSALVASTSPSHRQATARPIWRRTAIQSISTTSCRSWQVSHAFRADDSAISIPVSPPSPPSARQPSFAEGLQDPLPTPSEDAANSDTVDWGRSFHGLSSSPFSPEQAEILMQPISTDDIEIKPDGIIYLPEIKYRRILNKAFGPGGWGLAPRGETVVTDKIVTREYGLVCGGRLVSIARGEQQYFDRDGIPTATEGCKSNALMRCCKDLGIASELWDPRFIRKFLANNGREMMVEHVVTKKRRKHWIRKDDELRYPFKEIPIPGAAPSAAPATTAKPATSTTTSATTKPAYSSHSKTSMSYSAKK